MLLKFWWLLKKSVMGIMNLIATQHSFQGVAAYFNCYHPLPLRGELKWPDAAKRCKQTL